ncbi:efflux transporter periplasmic adaptor subunit [Xaviernesmea oryzae]|uniref:Efflux transporter periplasmic adaptor subunit n=1 Tax=Xaviernesmea oryzae TaxID=464029 RepID=A0A1Q9AQL0_9HYPH|nr:efflux RND transporter periplasmic adaptor subunit [Xaviernesmea oryzae]OLP57727.1 efflux transporter periplasmic adaptor subunit [Xaviernesmea oryzae]SEM05852.1 RND family efflux transporter, MFP subunit [Xaviernesmea oryzae]
MGQSPKFLLPAGLALLAGIALSACSQPDDNKTVEQRTVEITETALADYAPTTAVTGEIKARIQSELSFRVSGRITERLVDVGSKVTKGEVLARIDPREQTADVDVAQASLQAADAQLTQAQLDFNRQKNLFTSGVTSRARLDQAQEALLVAQATVESARTQLDVARDAQSYTELKADADGVITARNAEVGQVAQAAQSIFTLAHDGPRDAVFNVFESLFLQKPDDAVAVSLLSDPTLKVMAPVREISPTIDSATGTIRVKVGLDTAGRELPLGAPVVGTFTGQKRQAILLPWNAIASDGGAPAVWVVDPKTSVVSMKRIEVAEYETGRFAVSSGLAPKEQVVVDGAKFLLPGKTVSVSKEVSP